MSVRPRGATVLVALLLATLAAFAAPALASPVTATIRVEGLTGTVIPTTTLATDARPIVSTCCDTATEKHVGEAHGFTVPSALTLAADAAAANGLSLGCTWSVLYNDCFVDGFPAAFPAGATDYWRLVVNGKDSPTGFAGTALRDGDRVDVIATDYLALPEPPLLTLTPSVVAVHDGVSFSVKVTSLDTSGSGTTGPGAGAVVSYGSLQAVAGTDGTVSFLGTGTGYSSLSATLPGATSSQIVSVCSYGADPTICNLPAPATPVTPAAAAAATSNPITIASTTVADKLAPSTHFSAPLAFSKVRQVKRLVGVTSPDRSDVASVTYALARRVGTLCSFRRADGSLAPASSCAKAIWLPATGRAFWHVTLSKPLAAGRWRAFSRATDGAGNVEAAFESQTSFTVAP